MSVPVELRYTLSHEWVRMNDDGTVTVGITEHAQEQLGDLVFVETPEIDAVVEAETAIAVVESVKAASDIYAPINGTVIDANAALGDEPELVNSDPYQAGWLFSMQPSDGKEFEHLLDAESYQAVVSAED